MTDRRDGECPKLSSDGTGSTRNAAFRSARPRCGLSPPPHHLVRGGHGGHLDTIIHARLFDINKRRAVAYQPLTNDVYFGAVR